MCTQLPSINQLNAQLAEEVPWEVDPLALDDAHTKAYLLLQAHFGRVELPISDYVNDTKSVMDQVLAFAFSCDQKLSQNSKSSLSVVAVLLSRHV